jgi:hypothetical protein
MISFPGLEMKTGYQRYVEAGLQEKMDSMMCKGDHAVELIECNKIAAQLAQC